MLTDDYDANGFKAYQKYIALKNHFALDNYDYFKYNGKVKVTFDSFKNRKDKYHFNKLSTYADYDEIILANILKDNKAWIMNIVDRDGLQKYREWKKIQNSLTRSFKEDLLKLDMESFEKNFEVKGNQPPIIVKMALRSKINLETFSILQNLTGLSGFWREKVGDPILTPKLVKKAEKYHPFIEYDKKKIIEMIDQVF